MAQTLPNGIFAPLPAFFDKKDDLGKIAITLNNEPSAK